MENRSEERIDVRGPWPLYIAGLTAIELRGKLRDITVAEARQALGIDK